MSGSMLLGLTDTTELGEIGWKLCGRCVGPSRSWMTAGDSKDKALEIDRCT